MSLETYKGSWRGIENHTQSAVTVGTFDGIHLGHRQILDKLKEVAGSQNLMPTVMTFDPHPQEVLRSKKPEIRILTDIQEKQELLEQSGISRLVVLDFDEELSGLSPRNFVEEVFVKRLNAKQVIIGYDHAFGKDRGGSKEDLISMGRELGFGVKVVDPVGHYGTTISSTKIRRALTQGDVALAKNYLGRPYRIPGTVVPGDHRGSSLGFPTANICLRHPNKLMPVDAVYSGTVRIGEDRYLAAISIGNQPTFQPQASDRQLEESRILEVHLMDFQGDLYGEQIEIQFEQKIRDQATFKTAEELVVQIQKDVDLIKKLTEIST